MKFTDAQMALIRAEIGTYVEACPGAGKTQSIVQRFVDRPLTHPRKGVGLISFTNAAIDEARARCISEPALKEVPNFIGTIDGFINRFLVGPTYLARRRISPSFYESWSAVPNSHVKVNGIQFKASLDWFIIRSNSARLIPERVPIELRKVAFNLKKNQRLGLEGEALRIWKLFVRRGTLTASAARVALQSYLADSERREQLGMLLADRFVEVIVDEVQDCSEEDILVLDLLHEFGVNIIAVGDPDQSIYAFRSDAPVNTNNFLRKLSVGERLNGNFRSSPAICAAVNSLRAGSERDEPIGRCVEVNEPVVLLSYRRRQCLPKLLVRATRNRNFAEDDLMVIAHSSEHARVAAGAPSTRSDSTNKLVIMARAHHVIGDPRRNGLERVAAIRTLERTIRELGVADVVNLNQSDYLEVCGLSEGTFREACLRIAAALPRPFDMKPSNFRAKLQTFKASQGQLRWTSQPLRSPRGDTWPDSLTDDQDIGPLTHSTIHALKGRQSPAVALIIPEGRAEGDGVRQWCDGIKGEERRVLYVGASRAESLLIIAAHESVFEFVEAQLNGDGVPTVLA
ncbi:UvrD-helicase domain-containing protein [Rothia sp. AR01]|uniref:UvrD-helicase domain-containing protein n=1 Tax=Rothia santali TaxID=2949643 RepID=A0A9X2HF88_9MICC|nr:UvrD-helicase domain-containing protein [Rothia santali]MCP3426612.1 UvrD-helicase domain-containing protein [Rothia santali]